MTDGHENHPVHHLRVDSLGSSAQTQEPRKCVPLWMQWPRFWVVLCIIVAIVAVSIQNILSTDASKRVHLRESVLDLSKTYAGEVARQVRSSVSSVQALEAMMKIDDAGIALENFASLAEALISTYQGISNLPWRPLGVWIVFIPSWTRHRTTVRPWGSTCCWIPSDPLPRWTPS
ncbi:CHASE domain-containing protein [Durusdinium trenchii]|uniref:CHASE domain-containing protein n=1 Tax=Durusdinium trenchii TaxID=1381693 RepID=A0ABP0K6E4_9DINO